MILSILSLLETVASSNKLLFAAFLLIMFQQWLMLQMIKRISSLNVGLPPDARFGYTPQELYEWYEALGTDGRRLYKNMYTLDLFPYMETYAILGGALLYQSLDQLGLPTKISLLFPLAMWFDFLETVIPAYGCETYPNPLPYAVVQVAIGSNQLKWITFGVAMTLWSVLFVYTSLVPRRAVVEKKNE
jgi:hypothetical protein